VIEPGDLVLGDDDGLLAVPYDATEVVFAAASAKHQAETRTLESTLAGRLDTKPWVNETLRKLGCDGL